MPRTTPKEREERGRIFMTMVENINKLDKECANLYEKSVQIWKNLMKDQEMKVVESILRDAQEKVQKASENISTCHQRAHDDHPGKNKLIQ
jgi:hypothetical protein